MRGEGLAPGGGAVVRGRGLGTTVPLAIVAHSRSDDPKESSGVLGVLGV